MKLHSSDGDDVKVTSLTHSMESSMPKVVPVQLASEPIMRKQQSVTKYCLLDYYINQTCRLKGREGVCCTSDSPEHQDQLSKMS
ncbi:unnamed protein product [Hymenolepis diminuta]|uniref:Uncharacterized protein n=1 Tax=Hymenolepis diminuta TaxID=6216 RepID=A0A564YBF1_HYMDI|nr:unnamed protein product [Hymenolepis diminuta]